MILSFVEQQAIKPIDKNSASRYSAIANDVEVYDIDLLLGNALYQDVVKNPQNYESLLNAAEFESCDGLTLKHKGLKFVIAYLNYAKYVSESHIADTFSGLRQKANPDSETISKGDIERLYKQNRDIAFHAFELIKEYLDRNQSIYSLWKKNNTKKSEKFNFYTLRK